MATYIIQNQPVVAHVDTDRALKHVANKTWEQFLETTTTNQDEHVIKFVWTCWKENKDHHNPLYFACTALKLGILNLEEHEYEVWPWVVAGAAILSGLIKYKVDHRT